MALPVKEKVLVPPWYNNQTSKINKQIWLPKIVTDNDNMPYKFDSKIINFESKINDNDFFGRSNFNINDIISQQYHKLTYELLCKINKLSILNGQILSNCAKKIIECYYDNQFTFDNRYYDLDEYIRISENCKNDIEKYKKDYGNIIKKIINDLELNNKSHFKDFKLNNEKIQYEELTQKFLNKCNDIISSAYSFIMHVISNYDNNGNDTFIDQINLLAKIHNFDKLEYMITYGTMKKEYNTICREINNEIDALTENHNKYILSVYGEEKDFTLDTQQKISMDTNVQKYFTNLKKYNRKLDVGEDKYKNDSKKLFKKMYSDWTIKLNIYSGNDYKKHYENFLVETMEKCKMVIDYCDKYHFYVTTRLTIFDEEKLKDYQNDVNNFQITFAKITAKCYDGCLNIKKRLQ